MSDIPAQYVLDSFLPAGAGLWRNAFGDRSIRQGLQCHLSVENFAAGFSLPSGISLFDDGREFSALDHGGGIEESARYRVYSSDVRVKKIGRVNALPPQLRVE